MRPAATWSTVRILVIGALLLLGAIGLVAAVISTTGQATALDVRVDAASLCIAFALSMLYWLLGGLAWWAVLRSITRTGKHLSLPDALSVFFIGNLGRYVPGKVWYAVGRTQLAGMRGADASTVAASLVLEIALIGTSGGVMIALGAPFLALGNATPPWVGLLAVSMGLVALHPRVFGALLRSAARFTHRTQGPGFYFPEPPTYPVALSLLALYVGVWLVAALALFATLRAVSPVSAEQLPAVAGAWGIAFLSGYVAPLLPAGLGVREATASALLSGIVPLPIAVATAVLFRLLLTVAEALCLAPFLFGLRAMIPARNTAEES